MSSTIPQSGLFSFLVLAGEQSSPHSWQLLALPWFLGQSQTSVPLYQFDSVFIVFGSAVIVNTAGWVLKAVHVVC